MSTPKVLNSRSRGTQESAREVFGRCDWCPKPARTKPATWTPLVGTRALRDSPNYTPRMVGGAVYFRARDQDLMGRFLRVVTAADEKATT